MVLDFSQDNTLSQSRRKILRLTSRKIFKRNRLWVKRIKNFKFRVPSQACEIPNWSKQKFVNFFINRPFILNIQARISACCCYSNFEQRYPKAKHLFLGDRCKLGSLCLTRNGSDFKKIVRIVVILFWWVQTFQTTIYNEIFKKILRPKILSVEFLE